MLSKIKSLIVISILFYIWFSINCFNELRTTNKYILNTQMYIGLGDKFWLSRNSKMDSLNDIGIILLNYRYDDKGNIGYSKRCNKVVKIKKDSHTYIGYLTNKNEENEVNKKEDCSGYFYIDVLKNEEKFKLKENDIKEKFGDYIEYENPNEFLNENGTGSRTSENISEIIYGYVFIWLFYTLLTYIIYLIFCFWLENKSKI